ncbi:MAG: nickel pincer cofactor biosynthesis protein LarC [Clostridiales bacterium]|nr:nickel pincer cofactor biosynthesis protein LarC [Clostridiales bacterium]
MGKTLYLDCSTGISGDMTVAALLDLGADVAVLYQALNSLPLTGYQLRISRVHKSGLAACDFAVLLDEAHENHNHDMEYLYGHGEPSHDHDHPHDPAADHGDVAHSHEPHHLHDGGEHHHEHDHHHGHAHRNLPEILHIIRHGDLTPRAGALAERIFTILAQAEAKAHGVPVEEVHFHEVGAVDSIVDIVAAAVCFDNLDIERVILPRLNEGRGSIRCQHGVIPVPVPATLAIVQAYGLPLHIGETEGELVTPTGAAIAAAVATEFQLPDRFQVEKTGIGAGKRAYERPSLLRAMLITEAVHQETVWKLETNVDDCTGEALGYVMERLQTAGAREVHFFPVYMKKNRPAYQLDVLCDEGDIPTLENILFAETTTIGIRRMKMERTVLPRENRTVSTPLGEAQVKICTLPDGTRRAYPEYDSVAALCRQTGRAYPEVYQMVQNSVDLNR